MRVSTLTRKCSTDGMPVDSAICAQASSMTPAFQSLHPLSVIGKNQRDERGC
jgi:hypothetical protein